MKNEIIPEKIIIKSIRLFKSAIDVDEQFLLNPPNIAGYSFSFGQELGLIAKEKLIRLKLNVLLEAKGEDETIFDIKGDFGIEFIFLIENFKDYIEKEEDRINEMLMTTLTAIAYSTARGIIIQETQNTILGGIVLPVIDANSLLKENTKKSPQE